MNRNNVDVECGDGDVHSADSTMVCNTSRRFP